MRRQNSGGPRILTTCVYRCVLRHSEPGAAGNPASDQLVGPARNPAGTNSSLDGDRRATDADGDPITFNYVWKVGGVVKKTTTASALTTDTFDLSVAGNGDAGNLISVEVTPSDGTTSGSMVSTSLTVGNTAPVINSLDLAPNPPHTNETLTATVAAADSDGNPITFTYVWKVDGVTKKTTSATSATADTFDLSAAGNGDAAQVITVEVTPNDGTTNGAAVSTSTTVANTPPVVSSVIFS